MADLAKVAEGIQPGNVRKYLGTVVTVDGKRKVQVGDKILFATWADPLVVDDGDAVEVEIIGAEQGQSTARVTARSTTQPRSRTGKVTAVPASSPTIKVDAGGVTYDAEFIGSYAVNDVVHLDWGAGRPRVIGKVTQTAAAYVPPAPAPTPVVTTGQASAAAIRSGTFWGPGGWDSWAGGQENVFEGDYGSGPLSGAWFYGGAFNGLSGKTITRVQFRTGARRAVGSNNAALAFQFYAHSNPDRPGGDVNRVAGPFAVTIGAGSGPVTIDLPASFGSSIVNNGGIAIYGGGYGGMNGRLLQADSGALILDWQG